METTSSKYGKIRVPYAYLLDAKKYEGRTFSRKIKQPSLYILGLADKTVIPDQTRKVYEAANQPKQLVEIPGMDHFYKRKPEMLIGVNQVAVEFLVKNLRDSVN